MPENKKVISVTSGMRGFFAVMLWWNPEYGGFWEPWQSGIGSYATEEEAIVDAKEWAEAEGLEYLPKRKDQH